MIRRLLTTVALLLSLASLADAGPITFTTNTFSGTTTDYIGVGTSSLPFTNADGSIVSSTDPEDFVHNSFGLVFNQSLSTSDVLTYSGLPAGTTEVGFFLNTGFNDPGDYLASAEFKGPGGFDATFTGGTFYDVAATPYMGFISTTAFTSVTLTFVITSGGNDAISSYVSGTAVPEPSSLIMASLGGLMGLGFWLRHRRVKPESLETIASPC